MANFPFQRLQADLAALISRSPAGARLLSEPDLAKQLGVSRATLREAMRTFETQGLIRRRQGAGTFVVGQVPVLESGLEILESLETMAHRLGLEVSVSDLQIESAFADQEHATGLGIPLAARITRVRRVIRADSRPVAKALEIQRGDVLLQFISELYTGDGRIVDYSTSYFIPGYFNFHVVRRVGSQ